MGAEHALLVCPNMQKFMSSSKVPNKATRAIYSATLQVACEDPVTTAKL